VGGKATFGGPAIVRGEIEIGGVLYADSSLEYGELRVGGVATLRGNCSGKDIEVGGKLSVDGGLNFAEMEVGGYASITGDALGESIELGGRLSIDRSLKLSQDLEIGGSIDVKGPAEARDVEIGGALSASEFRVRRAELSGGARTENGIFASDEIEVSQRSIVHGWLKAKNRVEIESRAEVESIYADKVMIEDRARVRNVYGNFLEIGDDVEISGEILYTKEIRLGDDVRLRAQPIKVDAIPPDKSWSESSSSSSAPHSDSENP